ncbi:MAG: LptF/LptG family permease [Sulfurovum sp.]
MVNVRGYISSNFTKAFLIIFIPFFMIISLVYLVKISILTAQIQINFGELLLLYSYSLPDIVFYTLPISFVTALANVLIKLSQDNELIALYALGLKAKKVLRSLLILGLLFSILLLVISFLAMPLSKQFYKAFKEEKANDAKLNIVAGELGQKFGDYYIYVEKDIDGLFQNVVIYNRTNRDNEQFFSAKTGQLNNKESVTSLLLNDGYGYTYSKIKLQEAKYKTLEVYNSSPKSHFDFETLQSFWGRAYKDEKRMHRAIFFIFISLIPLLSVYLIASFSMINPRYQANRSFLVIFLVTLFFYFVASSLRKWGDPYSLIASIIAVWILGQVLFAKLVSRYF